MKIDIGKENIDPHQIYLARCRKNKIRNLILLILIFVILIYILVYLGYSLYFKTLVNDIYEAKGMDKDMGGRVTESTLSRLDFRSRNYREYGIPYTEYVEISFRPVLHWFFGGKATHVYSYERKSNDTNKTLYGSKDAPVTITFHIENMHIVIDEVYEAP